MASISKVYTVDEIKSFVTTNRAWAEKAIVRLFNEQTPSEQTAETTVYHNARGFSAVDAEIFSSFAKQIIRMGDKVRTDNGWHLSEKQFSIALKRLGKYAKQLHRLAYPVVKETKVESLSVEASELGLVPGEMYSALTYEGKTWNLDSVQMNGEDLAYWLFKSVDGAKLTVFND
jgi:hypothetical protein